jgi:hypothetical protein
LISWALYAALARLHKTNNHRNVSINNDDIHLLGYVYIHPARVAATALRAIAQTPSPIVQNAINHKQPSRVSHQTRPTLFAVLEVSKPLCAHAASSHAVSVVRPRSPRVESSVRASRRRRVVRCVTSGKACSYTSEAISLLLGCSLGGKELLPILLRCRQGNAVQAVDLIG